MRSERKTVRIDICVCTFKRVELINMLRSLSAMERVTGYDVAIIVVDNDWEPSAKTRVEDFADKSAYPITYIHGPAGNISVARNACLDASSADLIAFVDDDEVVTKTWLKNLTREMEISRADVVLGPVVATYRDDAPNWLKSGDFHSTYPVRVKGQIRTGYTCNVLMDISAPSLKGKRFNLLRGQTGGEDTEFFQKVFENGGRFSYCEDAVVTEIVPEIRASFGWLMKRKFRSGQTHGKLLAERAGAASKVVEATLALSKAVYCLFDSCLHLFNREDRNRALLRGALHVGTTSGVLGINELKQYGVSEKLGVRHGST